jgi:NAD(P)-dependent dehydrogenase (short-subunit alcohol dehydrogenase family)
VIKTVFITGADKGLGFSLTQRFLKEGARVFAGQYTLGGALADLIRSFPETLTPVQLDVTQLNSVRQAASRVAELTPTLDVLINNAAVQVAKPLVETTVEEWDAVMASNLRSVFLFVKLAHPLMKAAGGGAIVNLSSVHAIQTSVNIAAYAASKGGILALTRALAIEFAPDNIRVNAILPGAVDTPMLRAGLGRGHVGQGDVQERLDNLARKTVSGKVGKPEEIASAIYFLADNEQSSFMTGQALVVDGGATARLSTE